MRRVLRGLLHRARALLGRREWEAGLREELEFHLEMETEKLIREGHAPEDARRIARLRLGGEDRMTERAREQRGTLGWDRMVQDLRYGARTLGRAPGFTAVAVLTLALGIGANTALFSIVDTVLLRQLPYPEADELIYVQERNDEGVVQPGSIENFRDFRREASSFEAMAVVDRPTRETVLGLAEPTRAAVMGVARDFFAVAGVPPLKGRTLDPAEGRLGGRPEVVVSRGFWQRHLGEADDLGARTLSVGGNPAEVVGVMPAGFELLGQADIWFHLEQLPELPNHRGSMGWRVVGRLADGVDPQAAREELGAVAARIAGEFSDQTRMRGVELTPLKDVVVGDVRRALWILLAASTLVLLVACTNLAATTLARGISRERELTVRSALGAGRGRLLRQLVTESLLLAAAGSIAGLALAAGVAGAVARLAPGVLPAGGFGPGGGQGGTVGGTLLDPRVAAYSTLVAAGTVVLFGLLPTVGLLRPARFQSLRARSGGARGAPGKGPWGFLVATEVALAVVLLVGSGLLIRTLWSIVGMDPGYTTAGVVAADVDLPRELYPDPGSGSELYGRLSEELTAQPGVTEAGAVLLLPTFASSLVSGIQREGEDYDASQLANYRVVEGAYFETLGIPLVRGRLFDGSDAAGSPHVAVVNESMAERFWPGADALGQRFYLGGMDPYREDWITVVGIVGEARRWDRAEGEQPAYYLLNRQRPYFGWYFGMTFVVRGDQSTDQLAAAVRDVARTLDPRVPVEIEPLASRVADTWSDRRLQAWLLGSFALVALALAGVGIYGVVSYTVERRSRESAVRIALGAHPGRVASLIRRQTLVPVASGLGMGILGASALSRTLSSLLFGVSPVDPLAFGGAVSALLAVAWIGAAVPAHRSTRADPLAAMRAE